MQPFHTTQLGSKCLGCRHPQLTIAHQQPSQNVSQQNINDLNMIYIKCSQCQIIQCKPCFKQHLADNHHLREHQSLTNSDMDNQTVFEIICQECEQNDSRKFCQNCEQHLCDKCSFRIHNKGKRAKHNVLSNDILIRIQKLFFLNHNESEQQFKTYHLEFDPSNCLIVYSPQRPDFIEEFESLEVENMNKLSIEEIQSCLNRYPLISLFSVHQGDCQLTNMLTHLIVDSDNEESDEEEKETVIFLGGFRIGLQIRKNLNKIREKSDQRRLLAKYDEKDRFAPDRLLVMNQPDTLTTVFRAGTEQSSPENKKFLKKQSIDFSCGSKQQHEPILQMHKLFKKSLKMSNRSLIIQIPETKQYKQSPIKSDREQGFIERNMKLLQNANKQQKQKSQNKTITLHLDENYNDLSGSTLNYYEREQCRSNNQESILMMDMGIMNDIEELQNDISSAQSFRIIGNSNNNETITVSQSSSFISNNHEENNVAGSLSLLHVGNISLSTDNSIRKRSRKAPIPYFQPPKSKTIDNLNNSYGYMHGERLRNRLQKKFRELAQKGVLMINKKQLQQFGLGYDDKIIRKMKKTVCEQQIEYYSLNLQLISIQSLIWIIESIRADMMTPSQKLILSRLKESYNLKPAQKLWTYIIKYLESQQYINDKLVYDKCKQLPEIIVGREGDEVLLEYEERWVYEDQEGPEEMAEEWEMFRKFLNEYFKMNKQIAGGRYGCVQYVKLNGPQQLRSCSLGRLSYFVQQAINKGLIRYHKTLLIQNYQSFQQSLVKTKKKQPQLQNTSQTVIKQMFETQKQLKILKIQLTLIEIFLQAGKECEISLAQIPLTFKKLILFDVNLLQLGYPKLKNMLQTLTDKLVLSSSKSHIKYKQIKSQSKIQQLRGKYSSLVEQFVGQLVGIVGACVSRQQMILVNSLCGVVNERLGFVLDWRVCEVGDFCQFLMYYCQNVVQLQFVNGNFFVWGKSSLQNSYTNHNINQQYIPQTNFHPHSNSIQNSYHHPQSAYYCHLPSQCYSNNVFDHQQYSYGFQQQQQQYMENGHYYNNWQHIQQQQQQHYPPQFAQQQQYCQQPHSSYNTYQCSHHYQSPTQFYNPKQPYARQPFLPQPSQISTPKFNQSLEYINKKNLKQTIQNFKWESYLDDMSNFQDNEQKTNNFQNQSFTDYQSIYNLLDDDQQSQAKSKISFPKTFIQKQGSSCNHNQGELHISKITPIDERSDRDQECDQSLGLFDESPEKELKINIVEEGLKSGRKGQHTRVYSTTQARTKHQRMYSTTTAKN